ncbi:50S ribosomal protein L13 [Candidatus Woesearchaeota archaeon]|nr:50S ribosomal protein L13 [Candidatus Woesearchaeota archaeon]
MILDAKDMILGRLASYAAKKALLGESIDIINCEDAVVSGNKKSTLMAYKERMQRGSRTRGPFNRRKPGMFVKRVIRGMLPYKKEIGKKALKRIRCHTGTPDKLKDKKPEQLDKMTISKLTVVKYAKVKEICRI